MERCLMVSTLCSIAFVGSIIFSALIINAANNAGYFDSEYNDPGINMWYIVALFVGSFAGAYWIIGWSLWLFIVFPLVELAWLTFSFGVYYLGVIMGVFTEDTK